MTSDIERARQAGYDDGYEDALTIGREHQPEQPGDLERLGVIITDYGMTLRRQPWMTDEQWTYVRTRMTAWWNAWVTDWMASR